MRWRKATTFALVLSATALLTGCNSSALDLKKGDCFSSEILNKSPEAGEFTDITKIKCSKPHIAEVIASQPIADGAYPGKEALESASRTFCVESFGKLVGVALSKSDLDVRPIYPTEDSWTNANDREVLCVVISPNPTTGTVIGSAK